MPRAKEIFPCAIFGYAFHRFGSPALGAFDASETWVLEKREGVIKWKILVSNSCDRDRYSLVHCGAAFWGHSTGQDTRKVSR